MIKDVSCIIIINSMDRTESRDRKVLWRIGGVMTVLLIFVVGVIVWQIWQRQAERQSQQEMQVETEAVAMVKSAPEFVDYLRRVRLTRGTAFDFLAYVQVADSEESNVTVEGDYDLNMAGEYQLTYVAYDRDGREARQDFVVEVIAGEPGTVEILERSFKTQTGFVGEVRDGLTYVDGVLIANKTYGLPEGYGEALTTEVTQALAELQSAAEIEGMDIWVVSGFRSYETQRQLYNRYVARDGQVEADTFSARPGFSEHQTGLAVDLNLADTKFAETLEGQWLAANAYKYGFILRYPEGKDEVTGYVFEPWHFRYVGQELAQKLYNNGDWISLEEYFGITSMYQE